jgi:hypothetical protein
MLAKLQSLEQRRIEVDEIYQHAVESYWTDFGDSIRDRLRDAEQLGREGKMLRQHAILSRINDEVVEAGREAVREYRERTQS